MEVLLLSILLVIVQVAFLIVIIIATAMVIAGAISVSLDVPFVPTPKRYRNMIDTALQITPGSTVFELGSGTGGLMVELAKKHPQALFVGIELNAFLFAYSLMLKRFRGNPPNLAFRRENFFDTDLSKPNKIYGYLLTPIMDPLLAKLERETKGVRFASRAFQFKTIEPTQTIQLSKITGNHGEHMLYVYEFTKNPPVPNRYVRAG